MEKVGRGVRDILRDILIDYLVSSWLGFVTLRRKREGGRERRGGVE